MARVTHIAVNLLLIVAITMQPAFAYAFRQNCSADCTSGFSCQGCGCCTVLPEATSCACCSRKLAEQHEHDGCCGHTARDQARSHLATFDAHDPFAATVDEDGLVSEGAMEPKRSPTPSITATDELAVSSACHCIAAPKPLDAPAPRSSETDIRNVSSVIIVFGSTVNAPERPPFAAPFDAEQIVTAHFSQIAFCVWRL